MNRLPPHPWDRAGDFLISLGTVFGFVGSTIRLIIVASLMLGAIASVDQHSAPGVIILAVIFYVWHRSKISKLTKSSNIKPPSPIQTP